METDQADPKVGQVWLNKKSKREARITGITETPVRIEYHYRASSESAKSWGNTTIMSLSMFLDGFERMDCQVAHDGNCTWRECPRVDDACPLAAEVK